MLLNRKKVGERLFQHYKKDESGNYIIELSVPRFENLFSPYDPTPIHQKDIDPAIMNTILSQFVVFPRHTGVELHVYLPKKVKKSNVENHLEQALRHHFEYELLENELHLQRRLQKGLKTFFYAAIIFTTLFISSYLLNKVNEQYVLLHIFAEGLSIGAWVSLWHPIEMILYNWLPLYENKKKYSKLKDMRIKFKYT
jgi:hypothetical protein